MYDLAPTCNKRAEISLDQSSFVGFWHVRKTRWRDPIVVWVGAVHIHLSCLCRDAPRMMRVCTHTQEKASVCTFSCTFSLLVCTKGPNCAWLACSHVHGCVVHVNMAPRHTHTHTHTHNAITHSHPNKHTHAHNYVQDILLVFGSD